MTRSLPKINLYRNISISFVIFTIMLLVAVFLLFSNQATIAIKADPQNVSLSFNAEVKQNPTAQELSEKDVLTGSVAAQEKILSGDYDVLNTKTLSSDIVGTVEIVNKSSNNQPLLKTTQLQASNGSIVRTTKQVVVPAGGSVVVEVYPKESTAFSTIVPGRLTIIKLGASLQDKIYGLAKTELSSGAKQIKVLAQEDINRAQIDLQIKAVNALKKDLGLSDKTELSSTIIKAEANHKVGDQIDKFNLKLTVSVKVLSINQDQLITLLKRKISNLNLAEADAISINLADFSYTITDDNFAGGALVKINYSLKAKLDVNSPILDKSNFAGKSIQEVKQYLDDQDVITDEQVYVSPYWKSTLPKSYKRIKIIIQ